METMRGCELEGRGCQEDCVLYLFVHCLAFLGVPCLLVLPAVNLPADVGWWMFQVGVELAELAQGRATLVGVWVAMLWPQML